MIMKKYFIFAASALALASCSSDDFLGENPGGATGSSDVAIQFGGETGKITRATSNTGTDFVKLDNQFKIYGVKSAADSKYDKVFENYVLWDDDSKGTASNPNGWEYVGTAGTHGTSNVETKKEQTIKYWDYSSTDCRFVAGSPIANVVFNVGTNGYVETATLSGLAGHLNAKTLSGEGYATSPAPVYLADPVIVKKADYKKTVKFNFVRQQSKVRVGFYENIPGYKIKEIHFYKKGATSAETSTNVILTSATDKYFVGGENASATVTYSWTDTPSYTFVYNTTGLTEQGDWYAGKLTGVLATSSTETDVAKLYGKDGDMEEKGYFTVMPTPSATTAAAILIKCDYVLESEDGSNETITVKGATAAIPAAFAKWEPNTLYTYLFKISQNTNGSTDDDPTHAGLFPITFDAVVAQEADAKKEGTTTTVQTPSITTYQEGSVTDAGIKYVVNKVIKATVTESTSGTVKDINTDGATVGAVKVYKLSKEYTEAELQMAKVIEDEIKDGNKQDVTVSDNVLSFTPKADGYYAIQYQTTAAGEGTQAAYTYKIVHVEAAD